MKNSDWINTICNIAVILTAFFAAWYLNHKVKVRELQATHPQLAELLDFAGQLALKATNFQATEDKEGKQKLADATEEVYDQIKQLYPSLSLSKATVRNLVQSAYDKQFSKTPTDSVPQTKLTQPVEPAPTPARPVQPAEPVTKLEPKAPVAPPFDDRLDDLHL